MDERLSECWEQLSDFIIYRDTIDLGACTHLLQIFIKNSGLDVSTFPDQVLTLISAVSTQAKINPSGQGSILALLAINVFLNNLYFYNKSNDSFKPNSSTLYGWMSSSQMSIDPSQSEERDSNIVYMVTALASNQSFFKKLKFQIDRSISKQKYKKYIDILLQTVDFILGKSGVSKQVFLKLRTKYVGLDPRRLNQPNYNFVNSVIFSSQLNKVLALLTEGGDNVHSSLLTIYLGVSINSEQRCYQGVVFSGEEMLINLYRYYINSFKQLGQIFEQSKNPLFRLVKNHLALLYSPILRKFHQMIAKIGAKCSNYNAGQFYISYHAVLQSQLTNFLNLLPFDLVKLLNQLKQLIDKGHPEHSEHSMKIVKKLIFYSFLLNQSLIEEVYPRHDPSKFSNIYNYVINLFFQSSVKKFSSASQNELAVINKLIQKMAGRLDQMINQPNLRVDLEQSVHYKIRQSLLNYDYQLILHLLSSLQFTPKDSKQFEMKRSGEIQPESPVYKHFKTQKSKLGEGQQQLELATWISVGGSRQWGANQNKVSKGRVADRLKGLKTIGLKIRSQLQNQSEQFKSYYLKQ